VDAGHLLLSAEAHHPDQRGTPLVRVAGRRASGASDVALGGTRQLEFAESRARRHLELEFAESRAQRAKRRLVLPFAEFRTQQPMVW
jgi:hypothetical protein